MAHEEDAKVEADPLAVALLQPLGPLEKLDCASNFPAPLRDAFQEDDAATVESLKTFLPLTFALSDLDRAGKYYVRRLSNILEAKGTVSLQDRAVLAQHLCRLIHSRAQGLSEVVQSNWLNTLRLLLKKREFKRNPQGLQLDWRPWYDLLIDVHFPVDAETRLWRLSAMGRLRHGSSLARLIKKARHFFAPSASSEILKELLPQLSPFDNTVFQAQALLCLFLPTNTPADVIQWLPQVVSLHGLVDKSLNFTGCWLHLLSRAAKSTLALQLGAEDVKQQFDWRAHLPAIFHRFMHVLNLNVGGSNPSETDRPWPRGLSMLGGYGSRSCICKSMARLVVYTLGKESPSMDLISHLLRTISTFFHPSNTGKWSEYLAVFMSHLVQYFAKRLGKQRRGELAPPAGSPYELTPELLVSFRDTLMPVLMQALYSKSGSMVGGAERGLRHMAYLFPSTVLQPLLEQAYPALTTLTETHRMTSMLRVLAETCHTLFHRGLHPAGGAHLEQLLWVTLPGVDASDVNKTMRTMMFYFTLFYSVPLLPSTNASASGAEDAHDEARTATLCFGEWSEAFMERTLEVAKHQERFSKNSGLDRALLGVVGRGVISFARALSEPLFEKACAQLLEAVKSQIFANHKMAGMLMRCFAAARPAKALQLLLVPLCSKLLQAGGDSKKQEEKKAQQGNEAASSSFSGLSDEQLSWYMYLVSQVVRKTGDSLCASDHMSRIQSLLDCGLVSDDKRVRKTTGKVLRNVLASLTQVYPADVRSFKSGVWKEDGTWEHWKVWGTNSNVELDTTWYIPQEAALLAANQLILKYWKTAVKDVDATSDSARVERGLAVLTNLVRGAHSVLGSVDGRRLTPWNSSTESKRNPANADADANAGDVDGDDRTMEPFDEIGVDAEEFSVKSFGGRAVPILPLEAKSLQFFHRMGLRKAAKEWDDLSGGVAHVQQKDDVEEDEPISLRTALLRTSVHAGQRLLQESEASLAVVSATSPAASASPVSPSTSSGVSSSPASSSTSVNVKALKCVAKLLRHIVSNGAVRSSEVSRRWQTSKYMRYWTKQYHGVHPYEMRPVMIEKVEARLLKRLSFKDFRYTADVRDACSLLQRMTVHTFEKVRAKANSTLFAALGEFPLATTPIIHAMLDVVQDGSSTKEQCKGAISFLQTCAMRGWIARNWKRLNRSVQVICAQGYKHTDDEVQVRLSQLFSVLVGSLHALPLSGSLVADTVEALPDGVKLSVPFLTDKHLQTRAESLSNYTSSIQRTHSKIQAALRTLLERGSKGTTALVGIGDKAPLHGKAVQAQQEEKESKVSPTDAVDKTGSTTDQLHWRYELMTAAMSFFFTRAEFVPHDDVLKYFARGLVSDLYPLRIASMVALASLLGQFQPTRAHTKSMQDTGADPLHELMQSQQEHKSGASSFAPSTVSAEVWNGLQLCQSNVWGWNGLSPAIGTEKGKDSSGAAVELSETQLSSLADFLSPRLTQLVETLAQDHPTIHQSDRQRGFGAGDLMVSMLQDYMKIRWPNTRFARHSDAFSLLHVTCLGRILEACPRILMQSDELRTIFVELCSDTRKRDRTCTAAELFAAVVYATRRQGHDVHRRVESLFREPIRDALRSCQADGVPDWADALRFSYSDCDPRTLAWLTDVLLEEALSIGAQDESSNASTATTTATATATKPANAWEAMETKKLKLLQAPLVELGWRCGPLGVRVLNRIVDGVHLTHPYKNVREELGHLLFFALRSFCWPACPAPLRVQYEAAVQKLLKCVEGELSVYKEVIEMEKDSTADRSGNSNAATASPSQDKAKQQFLESVLYMCVTAFMSGDMMIYRHTYTQLMEINLFAAHHRDVDTDSGAVAQYAFKLASWADCPTDLVGEVVATLQKAVSSPAAASWWHTRKAALKFISVFVPRHSMALTDAHTKTITDIVVSLLSDAQVEVRTEACATLVGILMCRRASSFEKKRASLEKKCTKLSRTALPSKTDGNYQAAVRTRHGGVLGLVALALTQPYSVPEWLPALLERLSTHVGDPDPIAKSVKDVFSEFHRTHRDQWEEFKDKFTEEQLDAIKGVSFSPSYFA